MLSNMMAMTSLEISTPSRDALELGIFPSGISQFSQSEFCFHIYLTQIEIVGIELNDLGRIAKFLNTHRITLTCIFSHQTLMEIIVKRTGNLRKIVFTVPEMILEHDV